MATTTLDRPPAAPTSRVTRERDFEPNFGPQDMLAIRAIFGIMVGIFTAALVLYASIALVAG
jgi:hypothetical protein